MAKLDNVRARARKYTQTQMRASSPHVQTQSQALRCKAFLQRAHLDAELLTDLLRCLALDLVGHSLAGDVEQGWNVQEVG